MRHFLAKVWADEQICAHGQNPTSVNLTKLDQMLADYRATRVGFAGYLRTLELAQAEVIRALGEFEKFPRDDRDRALSIAHLIREFNEIRWRLAWAEQYDPNIDLGSKKTSRA